MNSLERYKETGIDWILEIPIDWNISRAKFLFKNKSLKNFPDEPLLSVTQRNGVVVRSDSNTKVWNPAEDVSGYKLIEPGDFVISLRSFEGGLELSDVRGLVSPAYTVLETIKKIDNHYFWWLMKSYQFIIELNKHVTGIRQGKNIAWDDFSDIRLIIPPLEEQKLISRYLDKKIEQIDKLSEKINNRVKLLKEQRTSLINQCVTKGLDPNVKMKNSGVKWIGNIPKHWVKSRFKYYFDFGMGETILKEQLSDTGYPVLSATENYDIFGLYNSPLLLLNEGDIVIPARGNSIGFVKVVREPSVSTQTTIYGKRKQRINTRFFSYFCEGNKSSLFQFEQTAIPQITVEQVQNNIILIPPLNEQEKIITELDQKCLLSEKLISKLYNRVDLLKEYRETLISSIVTGKVRVTEDMI